MNRVYNEEKLQEVEKCIFRLDPITRSAPRTETAHYWKDVLILGVHFDYMENCSND